MKRLILLVALSLLFLMPFNIFALDPNPQGELAVQVVASDNFDYIDEWVSTPSKHDIHIKRIKEVIPEQTFYVAVIATGYGLNDKDTTDLTADFILQNPDGSIQFHEKNIFTHKRHMRNLTPAFVMLDPAIDLTFEANDQEGEYVIKTILRDSNLDKTVTGKYTITLKNNK